MAFSKVGISSILVTFTGIGISSFLVMLDSSTFGGINIPITVELLFDGGGSIGLIVVFVVFAPITIDPIIASPGFGKGIAA